MKKSIYIAVFLAGLCFSAYTQDLNVSTGDLLLELRADGGYHLFIRKKPGIASVLLTETTRDHTMRADNYAYRSAERNPVNGNEIRIMNGVPIPRESRIYSLISSTVENHPALGPSFHIYIPHVLYYGYPEGRHGEVHLTDGTYLNIRAFALPYADYRGPFADNPFILQARQEPPPGPTTGRYMQETLDSFTEIALSGNGDLIMAQSPDDVVRLIRLILEKEQSQTLDIVLCLDTTSSMRKYIDALREKLIPTLNDLLGGFSSFRIGMVLFKDYNDVYLTRVIPFTTNFSRFQTDLNAIRVSGGFDIPEAVYEALYDGATKFTWESQARLMILIGDAPPHPKPRGKITKQMVDAAVQEREITVHAMILPQ